MGMLRPGPRLVLGFGVMEPCALIGVCMLSLQRVLARSGYAWRYNSHAAFGVRDTRLGPSVMERPCCSSLYCVIGV